MKAWLKRASVRNVLKHVLYAVLAVPAAPFLVGCWQVLLFGSIYQQSALVLTVALIAIVVHYIVTAVRLRRASRQQSQE